jgi:hypothetical protein
MRSSRVVDRSSRGVKGSLTRDFRLQVFFMNQCPPGPRVFSWGRFDFFRKFAEIFAKEWLLPVSTMPAINLLPVTTTPEINLSLTLLNKLPKKTKIKYHFLIN